MIDTKHVTDVRTLKFASSDDVLADATRLVEAERAGTLRRTGNWTLGQTFAHVAAFMDFPYDGYPPNLRPPWFVKALGPLLKRRFLYGRLPRGVKIPKVPGGTVGADNVPSDEGFARLKRSWARLDAAPPNVPNPVFGKLTHEEWKTLHCRHAELHFGFAHPV
jgi:hypothetical protein